MSLIEVGVTTAQEAADIINDKVSRTDIEAGNSVTVVVTETNTVRIGVLSGECTFASVAAGAYVDVDFSDGDIQRITLSASTTYITLVDNSAAVNKARQISLILKQGTGANKIVWDTPVKWSNGIEPILSYTQGDEDIITLVHCGNDEFYYGFLGGDTFRVSVPAQ